MCIRDRTYKTSPLVALFQMRADCGLRRGGLSLVDGELDAAATAVESLRARAESAAVAGRAAQTALVKAAEGDDVVGIGMKLAHARKLASAYARTEPAFDADAFGRLLADGRGGKSKKSKGRAKENKPPRHS